MAALPKNVNKSGFRKGQYVGYGRGRTWRIRKDGCYWTATGIGGGYEAALKLKTLAAKIEGEGA
jgi:hypothetical protein